jgi:decaprenyl-phosphate phosphoribosyltransferase
MTAAPAPAATTDQPDRAMSLPVGLLTACRPKQWAKNALVLIAPAAAIGDGSLEPSGRVAALVLLAVAVFSMLASGTYLINDSVDVESDRRHPTKRTRPIAAGVVPVPLALASAGVLIAGGLTLALWRTWQLAIVAGIYIVQTTAYSYKLKNEPVLDVVFLSGGFILRLLGGAQAVEVGVSQWFFILSCFGSLFIAVGKRLAEKRELDAHAGEGASGSFRRTLGIYTIPYLRFLQGVSAAIVLVGYAEWAFERATADVDGGPNPGAAWVAASILPFLVAILRYALLVETGKGSAPEDVLLGDRQMQVMGLIWMVLVGIGFVVAR